MTYIESGNLKKAYNKINSQLVLFICVLILFSACATQKQQLYNPYEVKQLSHTLSIPLSNKDKDDDKNMPLYVAVSQMLNTPYKYGGITKAGTDCSGLIYQVFNKVYHINMPQSTSQLFEKKYKKVSLKDLTVGDLIFFATGNNKKKPTHIGIYLKDNRFVHASTSKGVIVSSLYEDYYKKRFIKAVRVK